MNIGDTLPEITLLNQDSKPVYLKEFINKHPLVVYFYPKDNTHGCTLEACSFRDHYHEFEKANAKIFGISADSPQSHLAFIKQHRLNFALLSDPQHEAERIFGVKRNLFGLLSGRETFVFDSQGKLCYKFNSATRPTMHIKEALKALKQL
jgi:thioredoxin-dependent peroxiredoxin